MKINKEKDENKPKEAYIYKMTSQIVSQMAFNHRNNIMYQFTKREETKGLVTKCYKTNQPLY